MDLATLRRRLADAIALAEKEREKAEREHHPATRDREYGKVLMARDVMKWIEEGEAKDA